ncbi:hypothetical protein C0416_05235 [bacterium]|nr:hypothetical protein [bacterium]
MGVDETRDGVAEGQDLSPGLPSEVTGKPEESSEEVAEEPCITGTVKSQCENPNGSFIGISKKQRDTLGVGVGNPVEVYDQNGKLVGLFTVGKALAKLAKDPDSLSANNIEPGTVITVKKVKESKEKGVALSVSHGIENDERHLPTIETIKTRFPDMDSGNFIAIPVAVFNELTGGRDRVPAIEKGKISLLGKETEVVFVPTGTNFGLTTKAAESLNIPAEFKEIRLQSKDGVLFVI